MTGARRIRVRPPAGGIAQSPQPRGHAPLSSCGAALPHPSLSTSHPNSFCRIIARDRPISVPHFDAGDFPMPAATRPHLPLDPSHGALPDDPAPAMGNVPAAWKTHLPSLGPSVARSLDPFSRIPLPEDPRGGRPTAVLDRLVVTVAAETDPEGSTPGTGKRLADGEGEHDLMPVDQTDFKLGSSIS